MDPHRVVVVGYDDAELLDIACVTTTLDAVRQINPDLGYDLALATPGGGPITCSTGLVLNGQAVLERVRGPIGTLVVSGGLGHADAARDERLVGHVRRLARESERVASLCTGASVLAAAGLLDGRRATTHWHFAEQLAASYPAVRVDPRPIWVQDGNVYTAAGVTSALDLALSFIEADFGPDMARWVSRAMVTYLHRPGNQAQMSMFTAAPAADHDTVRKVADHIAGRLDADLSTEALARLARVSPRHLTRLFRAHLHQTPGRYVRKARVTSAAQLLSTTDLPVARIAARCGFASAEALRQAFAKEYGIAPSQYRSVASRT
ncbi:GlxA family transcriptional regulator [Glycomyces albidus]|uniref:Helix-turn-helix domain-containing protein n=1 Tax=Glycomyces albidus TaxID=2656774 RepID=A0A6L5G3T2_9ACTN|nr:GlxA family transcriptional regulator [Glycomyces albidus]MQM24073.1 helix-turn-helix domain-containing protein [Glycomyces albidus]